MTKNQDNSSDILKPNRQAILRFEVDNYQHSLHKSQLNDPLLSPVLL